MTILAVQTGVDITLRVELRKNTHGCGMRWYGLKSHPKVTVTEEQPKLLSLDGQTRWWYSSGSAYSTQAVVGGRAEVLA